MNGKFEEASIGIFAYDKNIIPYLNNGIKFDSGIYVASISSDSPAKYAKLQEGDIITKIDGNKLNKMADFFSILGDTTRVKILDALDKNELCVCDIANVLRMSKSSISHQLGTLRRSGIVKCRRVGKEVFYTLDDEHVREVFEVGMEHIEHRK